MRIFTTLAALALTLVAANAQIKPQPPKSLRVYVFDCGLIKGLNPETTFHLKKEELVTPDFVVPCYLVVHPRGTLMWDVGTIPDEAFDSTGAPVTRGIMSVTRPLKAQLAATG